MRSLEEGQEFLVMDEFTEALTGETRKVVTAMPVHDEEEYFFVVEADDAAFYNVGWSESEEDWVGVLDDEEVEEEEAEVEEDDGA